MRYGHAVRPAECQEILCFSLLFFPAVEEDLETKVNCCALAAAGGRSEVPQWLWEQGCPWGTLTYPFAVLDGLQEILKWARRHDCPWDWEVCAAAAESGTWRY
jgi:hypothetical protein